MHDREFEGHLEELFSDTAVPDPIPVAQDTSSQPSLPTEPASELPESKSEAQEASPETEIASDLRTWRAKMLNALLTIATLLSIPVLVLVIIQATQNPEQWPAVVAFLIIYLFLLTLTFFRRLDIRLRAWGLLLVGFAVGVLDMSRGGLAGNGGMYFLVLSALAVILVGLRSGVAMAGLSLLAYAVLAVAAKLGWLSDWLVYHENPLSPEAWASAGSVLMMLLALLVSMQWLFSRFLLNTLQKARQAAATLRQTHELMQKQTRKLEAANRLLEKRAGALAAASEVSRAASSMLDPQSLIRQMVNLIRDGFDYYYVGLFLIDTGGQWAELKAGTGEAGRQMLDQAHRLQVGSDSMIGWCAAHGQARIALDVGTGPVRFDNPLLPETRSEMALPLISRGHVIGALTVQSTESQAFSDEDIAILQTMADQVANAIENARLLQETERLALRNRLISEVTGKLRGTLDLEGVLRTTVRELGMALDVSEAVIRLGRIDDGRESKASKEVTL